MRRKSVARKETRAQRIARLSSKRFLSLQTSNTDVCHLVRFVLAKHSELERAQLLKIGDDARDHMNTGSFLIVLSSRALGEVVSIRSGDMKRRLKEKTYPFSRLKEKTRDTLLHLPASWVRGGAGWLLAARKSQSRVSIPAD